VISFPNPLAAVSQMVAKAFAIIGDRDSLGGRQSFGISLPLHQPQRTPSSSDGTNTTGNTSGGD
jgi:hypothetical protein